jgi:uncharacterized protein
VTTGIDKQIVTLERLAAIDATIKELTQGKQKWQGELDGVRQELSELEARLAADQASITEMEKTRGDCIQEMRNVSGQIDRSRERLQRARNERESNAAERELDELRKIQRDRDDEVKKLQELTAAARTSTVESEQRREELQATLDGSLEGTMSTIGELDAELAAKQKDREAVKADLPNMVGRRYERLHERGKVPIAKTTDGTCLGCFVKLPPMMFHNMLSRTKFDECPQCHRIIYYVPPPTKEELEAAEAAKALELQTAGEAEAGAEGDAASDGDQAGKST